MKKIEKIGEDLNALNDKIKDDDRALEVKRKIVKEVTDVPSGIKLMKDVGTNLLHNLTWTSGTLFPIRLYSRIFFENFY